MFYRREIDGLRTLAVVPVILFHSGMSVFGGGFVGVDVFFVISGYLITSIILADIEAGRFSLAYFYERRARRILPALLFVIAATIPFAESWMMPDEFKNFGQSMVATTVFSNNILLAATSDYWSLASEFKPLLHTWSLGVEEQYYMIFPLILMLCWRLFRNRLIFILCAAFAVSLTTAVWGVTKFPAATFYLLPTRAWEILLGALVAYYHAHGKGVARAGAVSQSLSAIGVLLIVFSVFVFDENFPSPGLTTLAPTIGAVLIILFAFEGTITHRFLGSRAMVGVGLISYSLYLWHQPIFALARIYSPQPVGGGVFAILIVLCFAPAYLSWRFIEIPFRNKATVSRKTLVYVCALGSASAFAFGVYLNYSYGMLGRFFDAQTRIEDIDKRFYNERVFHFKNDIFSSQAKLKVLVSGNSFGRDFVNMTTEVFDVHNVEIVYRDDLSSCILPHRSDMSDKLFYSADVIIFASDVKTECVSDDIKFAQSHGKEIFYIGTKDFGYNLNWLIRLPPDQRRNQYNQISDTVIADEANLSSNVPPEHFISLLSPVLKDGKIPVTDDSGRVLSTDRRHVTKYGAIFFGEKALLNSRYGAVIKAAGPM